MRTKSRNTKSECAVDTQLELYCLSAACAMFNGSVGRRKSAEEIAALNRVAANQSLFVIKKHDATRLHYDLRLGWNYVLLSWAIPDGPSYCPEHKREAIQVEDHPRENAWFEGVIPEGRRGAGTVMLWDEGIWELQSGHADMNTALRDGCLKFTMHGQKIKGNWTLVRTVSKDGGGRRSVWLLSKDPDEHARTTYEESILEEAPNSVFEGKSLEEIYREWVEGKSKDESQGKLFPDIIN